MARCEGTTKDGARCRRPAKNGTKFCSWHAAQVDSEDEPGPSEGAASSGRRPRKKHPLADVAVVGIVAVVLLTLRRVIRF